MVSSRPPRCTSAPGRRRHLLRAGARDRRLFGAEVARHHSGVVPDLVGRAVGDHAACLQCVHPVADTHQQRHVVLHDEDGAIELVANLPEQGPERFCLALGPTGRMTPEMTFISVVLPAPLAPMRPRISPGPTVMSGSSRATMPPNRTWTPVTSSGCADPASGSGLRRRSARTSR